MSVHGDVSADKIQLNLHVNRRSTKNADTDGLSLIVHSYFVHTPQLLPASEPIYLLKYHFEATETRPAGGLELRNPLIFAHDSLYFGLQCGLLKFLFFL